LPRLANGFASSSLHDLGEDVADAKGMFAKHVRVDADSHGWACVPKPGGHHMDPDSSQQERGRVQVAQIVLPAWGSGSARA
jgi:hypothetical protein